MIVTVTDGGLDEGWSEGEHRKFPHYGLGESDPRYPFVLELNLEVYSSLVDSSMSRRKAIEQILELHDDAEVSTRVGCRAVFCSDAQEICTEQRDVDRVTSELTSQYDVLLGALANLLTTCDMPHDFDTVMFAALLTLGHPLHNLATFLGQSHEQITRREARFAKVFGGGSNSNAVEAIRNRIGFFFGPVAGRDGVLRYKFSRPDLDILIMAIQREHDVLRQFGTTCSWFLEHGAEHGFSAVEDLVPRLRKTLVRDKVLGDVTKPDYAKRVLFNTRLGKLYNVEIKGLADFAYEIACGHSREDICSRLRLSTSSFERYTSTLRQKLGSRSTQGLFVKLRELVEDLLDRP